MMFKTFKESQSHQYQHDGDCMFYGYDICTCGLLHELTPQHEPDNWYPEFWEERHKQLKTFDMLFSIRMGLPNTRIEDFC